MSSDQFRMQDNCLICLIDSEGNIVNEVFEAGLGHAVCTCGIPIEGGFFLAGWTGPVIDGWGNSVETDILLLRLNEYGTPIAMDVIPLDDNREPLLSGHPGFICVVCPDTESQVQICRNRCLTANVSGSMIIFRHRY